MVDALLVFNPLQGFSFFALRSPCADLHRCNTSVTSPTLAVYNWLASSAACALVFCSPLLVDSTVRFLASPLPLRVSCRLPLQAALIIRLQALRSRLLDDRFPLVSASCAASLRTYRLSLIFAPGRPFARSRSKQVASLRSLQNSFSRRLLLFCLTKN